MGQHVTYWNGPDCCAAEQVRQAGYGGVVLESRCDIGRTHKDHTCRQVVVIRAGRPWGAAILRDRQLAVMMAAFLCNWSMLLWTRPKDAQRPTADAKEPCGIKNRDDRQRHKTLPELSRAQTKLLLPLDGSYGSEVAASIPQRVFLFCMSQRVTAYSELLVCISNAPWSCFWQTDLSLLCPTRFGEFSDRVR
jgi:hypothetical protein